MAFDISTAKPEQSTQPAGFDISTAKPEAMTAISLKLVK